MKLIDLRPLLESITFSLDAEDSTGEYKDILSMCNKLKWMFFKVAREESPFFYKHLEVLSKNSKYRET